MPTTFYQAGLGASAGSDIATAQHFVASTAVYYVDPVTGSASYTGRSRKDPKASIANLTLAAGDIVILMGDDTIDSPAAASPTLTLPAGVSIIGEGTVRPILTLSATTANTSVAGIYIPTTASNCLLDYLDIKIGTVSASDFTPVLLDIRGPNCYIRSCRLRIKDGQTPSRAPAAGEGTPLTIMDSELYISASPATYKTKFTFGSDYLFFENNSMVSETYPITEDVFQSAWGLLFSTGVDSAIIRNYTGLGGILTQCAATRYKITDTSESFASWFLT